MWWRIWDFNLNPHLKLDFSTCLCTPWEIPVLRCFRFRIRSLFPPISLHIQISPICSFLKVPSDTRWCVSVQKDPYHAVLTSFCHSPVPGIRRQLRLSFKIIIQVLIPVPAKLEPGRHDWFGQFVQLITCCTEPSIRPAPPLSFSRLFIIYFSPSCKNGPLIRSHSFRLLVSMRKVSNNLKGMFNDDPDPNRDIWKCLLTYYLWYIVQCMSVSLSNRSLSTQSSMPAFGKSLGLVNSSPSFLPDLLPLSIFSHTSPYLHLHCKQISLSSLSEPHD